MRTSRGATPSEVKAFEATLLELNAILRRAPGVAEPRGYSVETWGSLSGPGLAVPGRPDPRKSPLAGALDFGAFPIFEYERNGKMIREDTGETALQLFQVNDPWITSGRGPQEWGVVETDAFMQPKPKGEVAGIPLYGDTLVIAKSPETLWTPVPLGASLELVAASRRADVASYEESFEKFKARLAIVQDPAKRALRMKTARENAAKMPNPDAFVAQMEAADRIEEESLLREIGPTAGTGKGLADARRALAEVTTWIAELSPAERDAPSCYAEGPKDSAAGSAPTPAARAWPSSGPTTSTSTPRSLVRHRRCSRSRPWPGVSTPRTSTTPRPTASRRRAAGRIARSSRRWTRTRSGPGCDDTTSVGDPMSSDDTYCPVCDRCFKWYETVCPSCGGDLSDAEAEAVAATAAEGPPAVSVFESDDAGEADVVRAALAQEGIVCVVSGPSPFVVTDTGERSVVTVLREDAERARAVVEDLDAEDDGDATDAAPASALPAPGRVPEPAQAAQPGLATVDPRDADSGLVVGRSARPSSSSWPRTSKKMRRRNVLRAPVSSRGSVTSAASRSWCPS